jgi:type IX secretion system PorP/SprF family membrane protein
LLFFVVGHMSFAQQLPIYSQYLYNKFLINPAHAGSDGFTSINLTAREQWVGYTGAPRTYSLSWQTRILKKGYRIKQNIFNRNVLRHQTDGKVGFGGYVFSDKNGLIQKTGFQATYAYHTWIDDYTQLSMGVAFTGYHYIINGSLINFGDPNEPWLNNELRRGVFIPDADCGIYLLNPKYEVGLSALQMFGAAAKIGEVAYNNYYMDRHYYLFGSYSFETGIKSEIQPSLLVKMSQQLKPQADIGLTYNRDQAFWAGLAYRTGYGGALISNIRFRFVPSRIMMTTMYFGYAFDFTFNKIQRATFGTHEITLALKFGDSQKRFRWIDRF